LPCRQPTEIGYTTAGQSLVLLNGKIPHRKVPKRIIQKYEMDLRYEPFALRDSLARFACSPASEAEINQTSGMAFRESARAY